MMLFVYFMIQAVLVINQLLELSSQLVVVGKLLIFKFQQYL